MPQAMEILVKYLLKPTDQILCFHDELGHPIPLNLTRIMYVEAKGKYQDVVSIDDHTMIRCSITELEKALSPHAFLRIHRGYLVNARYIYRIHTNHILLDSGQKLPLSLQRKKEVQNLFLEYVRSVSSS